MIEKRIYGSLSFGPETYNDAAPLGTLLQHLNSNPLSRDTWARQVSNNFKDGFVDCDDGQCVIDSFCNENTFFDSFKLFQTTDHQFSDKTKIIIKEACLYEGWRFQEIMAGYDLAEACSFSFVPKAYAEDTCE